MGMSSSQARLLSLTGRMHDIEYKAQKLQAQKLQLANESDHVYQEYENALNMSKIQLKQIGADGSAQFVNVTYNSLIAAGYKIELLKDLVALMTKGTAGTTSTQPTSSKGPNGKFIDDIVTVTPDVIVTDPTQLASAISGNTTICIANAETLAKLAKLVNSGTSCEGKTITLTSDIDLSAYSSGTGWTPIGMGNTFCGTFDGQGHVVKNLYINNPTADYQGLFGNTYGDIKNVGVENCNITGRYYTGGLVGVANGITSNCYVIGNVIGEFKTGGLVGITKGDISNSISYAQNVSGIDKVGSFVGEMYNSTSTITDGKCLEISGLDKIGYGTDAQTAGIKYIELPGISEENKNNTAWLSEMIQSGYIILSKPDNDGNYYEVNIATDTNLQEITDPVALKKAEAQYEADMKRIDRKDAKYDTQLAKVDTERNAIKQEMETLKTVAKENVERTFKLFS